MKLLTHESQWHGEETAVSLGMFDGLHQGHAKLMRKASELAQMDGIKSVVYTFSTHPMQTYAPDRVPLQIQTRSEKIRALAKMGLDAAILRPFNKEYASQEPEQFVEGLVHTLKPKHIIIGFNYSFGKKGIGKADDMRQLGEKYGFKTHIIQEVTSEGTAISSTRVRAAIAEGNMEETARLLGGYYTLNGIVRHGKKLGRTLGFPTANLYWPEGKAIPAYGVYATKAYVRGKWYSGATNIGRHPTTPDGEPTIEVNLLDYDGNEFYGDHMRLILCHHIRPERKFDSLQSLREEVMRNREQVRAYFEAIPSKELSF